MNFLEPVAIAVGEASAYLLGRILHKTFKISERRAQNIGESMIAAAVLGAAVVITLIYS